MTHQRASMALPARAERKLKLVQSCSWVVGAALKDQNNGLDSDAADKNLGRPRERLFDSSEQSFGGGVTGQTQHSPLGRTHKRHGTMEESEAQRLRDRKARKRGVFSKAAPTFGAFKAPQLRIIPYAVPAWDLLKPHAEQGSSTRPAQPEKAQLQLMRMCPNPHRWPLPRTTCHAGNA